MSRYRFGTFTYETETAELRRDGAPVRLQAQPARVLSILPEHAGEIVTRETLQQTIWSDGTQVDFERGLNYCIAQVRSALGDSANPPRFVRTIPKKGYQFIGPVEKVADNVKDASSAPPPLRKARPWAAAAVVALLGFGGLGLWLSHAFGTHLPIVAVCLFDNETGETRFDTAASGFTDALTVEMVSAGAGKIQVIGNAEILRRPRPQRNPKQIHAALGADYVVIGQIQMDSAEVRILAHLLKMPQQTHVAVERLDSVSQFDAQLEIERTLAQRATAKFLKALERRSPDPAGH